MRCACVRLVLAVLAFSVGGAGCGGSGAPCTSMGATSDLVARAAVLRLDVYDGSAQCDGNTVGEGAPPPSLSKVVAAGQPIHLDVPAGRHVLLLSAFADGAGTELVGSACTESDVVAGKPLCFNLTLAEAPDASAPADLAGGGGGGDDLARAACTASPDSCPAGQYCASDGNCAAGCKANGDCAGTPSTPLCDVGRHVCVQCLSQADCALGKLCSPSGTCVDGCVPSAPSCPSAQMCCTNLCIDTSKDLSNCGGCGRACSSAHVATPSCAASLCAPTCTNGWADCNHPIAPATDDGCETSTNDVNHCGGCNTTCSLPHATPDCPSGSCVVKACASGYFDCNGAAADGCECPGMSQGAGGGCCAGGTCQSAHSDGFGHPFYDCIAAGTYSEQLARDAAAVFPLTGNLDTFLQTCGGSNIFCKRQKTGTTATACGCWAYSGTAVGYAKQTAGECMCPTTGDTPWQ